MTSNPTAIQRQRRIHHMKRNQPNRADNKEDVAFTTDTPTSKSETHPKQPVASTSERAT